MENFKIALEANIFIENSILCFKVNCSKSGGSGNFKTSKNSRRTCLECYSKGHLNI